MLAFDELAEISARELLGAIYMLANGVPKTRMTSDAILQESARWRLALISSGEISVADKLSEASMHAMAGHEVRLIDVEADSRRYGVFDHLHKCATGAEMSDKIHAAVRGAHGVVGRHFVEHLIESRPTGEQLSAKMDAMTAKWRAQLPADPNGQVMRVAHRFALIALAGQMATEFGLTGWPQTAAEEAAEAAFLDWYDRLHGDKHDAASEALLRLKGYVAADDAAIFKLGCEGELLGEPEAWRDASRLYILPEVWARIMLGLDEKAVCKALVDIGVLQAGDGGRLMRKAPRTIPGRPRLYTVNMERVG